MNRDELKLRLGEWGAEVDRWLDGAEAAGLTMGPEAPLVASRETPWFAIRDWLHAGMAESLEPNELESVLRTADEAAAHLLDTGVVREPLSRERMADIIGGWLGDHRDAALDLADALQHAQRGAGRPGS